VEQEHKDWASFNAGIPFDPVVPRVYQRLTDARAEGLSILITSGRQSHFANRAWLHKHDVPFDYLYMRNSNDFRKDDVIKEEIYHSRIEPFFNVVEVWDDRPMVCDMWRRLGLNLIQVVDPELPPSPVLFRVDSTAS
jgi:hypothetical protein